jgi:hypothetical protein
MAYSFRVSNRLDDPFSAGLSAGQRFAEERTAPRYCLMWSVEVFEPTERTRFAAHTKEVSVKGCSVHTQVSFAHNTIVRLQIRWRQELLEVWARVTGTTSDGTMGLAFLGAKHQEALARWLSAETGKGHDCS